MSETLLAAPGRLPKRNPGVLEKFLILQNLENVVYLEKADGQAALPWPRG